MPEKKKRKKKKMSKVELVDKLFGSSNYAEIDKTNLQIILDMQENCLYVSKICNTELKKIKTFLKSCEDWEERRFKMQELDEVLGRMKTALSMFKSVQPQATKDVGDAIRQDLEKIRSQIEFLEEEE